MKNDVDINIRLPAALRRAIERERQRMSRTIGAEIKLSAVIRAALEKEFGAGAKTKSSSQKERAA